MKGISSIIAVLMIIVITIALLGMASTYIFRLFRTGTQGISVDDFECVEGATEDEARVWIRNIGDSNITVTVTQTAPSADTDANQRGDATFIIQPGQVHMFTDVCGGTGSRYCVYKFIPSMGRSVTEAVPCT